MVFESSAYFIHKIFLFCNYIDSAKGFPKPLTPEEEKDAFEKMKNGDMKAREKLITHNLRLVAHIVKIYRNSLEADDLLSVGTIGLMKAIDNYDPSKKSQLSTYAARCIHNEILMLIRANKKHKHVLSMNGLIDPSDEDGLEIKDVISTDDDQIYSQVENKILFQQIQAIMDDKLSDREKEIIKYRYGIDCKKALTQQEIADKLGISRSYVSRIETKALGLIRDDLKKEDNRVKRMNLIR